MSSGTRGPGHTPSTAGGTGAGPEVPGTARTRGDEDGGTPPVGTRRPRPELPALLAIAGVLGLCLALVLFGVLRGGGEDKAEPGVPTEPVTYEVTGEGTADLSYQGASEQGTAETVSGARLPWKKTVAVPRGQSPVIRITLGEQGGQARCAVAVRGRHVQSATASGGFGRATCAASLPAPAPEPSGSPSA
ncbi:hypothetical protein ACFY65_25350 [Streptomyces cellulosae]